MSSFISKVVATIGLLFLVFMGVISYLFLPTVRTAGNATIAASTNASFYPSWVPSIDFIPLALIWIPIAILVIGLLLIWVWNPWDKRNVR